MVVVSAREFRAQQTKVLSAALEGESVLLTSRIGNFKIVPVSEDDKLIMYQELKEKMDKAIKDMKEGKTLKFSSEKDVKEFFGI